MIELVVTVALVLFVAGGCSLMEAVLYAIPLRQVETGATTGGASWKLFRDMRRKVDRPIAAVLSLNTMANTAGAALAGSAANAVFGHDGMALFSAALTVMILLFAEILPKTVGVVYGRRLVGFVAYPLRTLVWLMTPVTAMTGLITRVISRGAQEEVITRGELLAMARLGLEYGTVNAYQEKVIQRILTLQNRFVKDVMTPRTVVFSLDQRLTVGETKALRSQWEHSRVPVYDRNSEDLVGIVLTKDLFVALLEGRTDVSLSEIKRPVHFVAESARLSQVLREFLDLRQHLFVVLDEYGGLSGLVSLEDILEEILGAEIVDESDQVADKRELARQRRKKGR